jgi:Family of unknown function (DUF6297)
MTAGTIVEAPDTTDAAFALLREVRGSRARARARASGLMFWLYIAGLAVLCYGGWLVADIANALRHPPPRLAVTPDLARGAPAALCALAVLLLAALLWDARWRGPVTVARPTADWLLDTPVRRDRLLRPRYRASALGALAGGAVAGLVPVAALLAAGLGGHTTGHELRLAAVTMAGTALLAACGTGLAARAEVQQSQRSLRAACLTLIVAAAILAGLAVASATFQLPHAISTALLWSGPWGWAAQGPVALSSGGADSWPAALGLLALTAVAALVAGDRAAARVPAAALRARARTMGDMSAAMMNLDTRRITTAYRDVSASAAASRFWLRPPRRSDLVLMWRDLVALRRVPYRIAWSAVLAFGAVGLGALAARSPRDGLLPLALALIAGYLAATGLCEGARLDADDPRRSGSLPFSFRSLPLRHAVVPATVLLLLAAIPAVPLAVLTGHAALLVVLLPTVAVLVGGALINAFRGQLEAEMFAGFDTPMGNSSGVTITLWYATGPLLAIVPLLVICRLALISPTPTRIVVVLILGTALTTWLASIATRRAERLRAF